MIDNPAASVVFRQRRKFGQLRAATLGTMTEATVVVEQLLAAFNCLWPADRATAVTVASRYQYYRATQNPDCRRVDKPTSGVKLRHVMALMVR